MGYAKRAIILSIVFVYLFSFFGYYGQYWEDAKVYAQSAEQKVDIVAVFVDNAIYGAIKSDLDRYTNTYIPKQSPGSKALVFPITPSGFHAKDIQHILQNLYYDGEKGMASQLAGVILFGEIPLPVVELGERRFSSIYPYVDFDDPMFLYNPAVDLFEYNNYPASLPEVRHGTIPVNNVGLFTAFFSKLKEYAASPGSYAKSQVWIEDFTFMKDAYTEEELDHYINQMLFSENEAYRRMHGVFGKILKNEFEDDLVTKVEDTQGKMDSREAQLAGHEAVEGDEEVAEKSQELIEKSSTVMDFFDPAEIREHTGDGSDKPTPTLMLEKTLEEEFDNNQVVFGDYFLSELQDNLLAGGRYQLQDIDLSSEKIAFRDDVSRQYLEDVNTMFEDAIDKKMYEEEYFMKYPLPYLQIVRGNFTRNDFGFCQGHEDSNVIARYENHYFGRNAADALETTDLHIYRGQWSPYNNLVDAEGLLGSSLVPAGVVLDDRPGFDHTNISVGAGYGWMSQQVEQNRAFNFNNTFEDKGDYDEYKEDDEQELDEFSYNFWGGGAALNIDTEALQTDFRYPKTNEATTDYRYARHPTLDKRLGGPWYDVAGGVLLKEEIDVDALALRSQHDYASIRNVNNPREVLHANRAELNDMSEYTSYEEMDFFDTIGPDGRQSWGVFENQIATDNGFPGYGVTDSLNFIKERIEIYVHAPHGGLRDLDEDGIKNMDDTDIDGDGIDNAFDDDIDGDRLLNGEDYDINGNGPLMRNGNDGRYDPDMDSDGIPNGQDADMNGNGIPNGEDPNMDSDWLLMYKGHEIPNTEDADIDGDLIRNRDDTIDMDGDGIPNMSDPDTDSDGIPNTQDPDIDQDRELNERDASSSCGGGCNGSSSVYDTDADGIPDELDDDQDGDGLLNSEDGDQDGDGLPNAEDADVDADGQLNDQDADADNDGTPNTQDDSPWGFDVIASVGGSSWSSVFSSSVYAAEECSGDPSDVDEDGLVNYIDPDIDGDGLANHEDMDIDGDGLSNSEDMDMDCDGVPNAEDDDIDADGVENGGDHDCDGDGIPNGQDPDADGDGIENGQDPDVDGDGIENGQDPDVDGDGIPNGQDYEDIDGDGIPNDDDRDMDGDGIPNADDEDIDGDGIPNGYAESDKQADGDCNCNGKPDSQEEDSDSDGVPNTIDPTPFGVKTTLGYNGWGDDEGEIEKNASDECFDVKRVYRYQLINQVSKHTMPDYEELDAMHAMTHERPVDDPRYTAFVGVGGDLVKFNYPDLYRVNVFAGGKLQEKEDIERNIEQYLRDKVQVYNQYLDVQLQKAPAYYATQSTEYDFLKTVDEAASPDGRAYELYPEDFLIDVVGERNIKRIAESLYHINVPWKEERPQGATVGEYIEDAREKFDLNKKIEFILDDYLQYDDPGEDFWFDAIAYPTHIDKKYAYEVGIISSDGNDIIQQRDLLQEEEIKSLSIANTPTTTPTAVRENNTLEAETIANENAEDDALCNISSTGQVPLLKWPKAMKCWREKTIEKPVEFSLDVSVEWELIDDVVRAADGDLGGLLGDDRERTEEAIKKLYQGDNESDGVRINMQYEPRASRYSQAAMRYANPYVVPGINGGNVVYAATPTLSSKKVNAELVAGYSDVQLGIYDTLLYDVYIGVTDDVSGVDGNELIDIDISARTDVGNISVNITSLTDVCSLISRVNICNQPLVLNLNPYTNAQKLPVTFPDTTAGQANIRVELCKEGVCVVKDITHLRTPGDVTNLSVTTVTEKIIAGAIVPLRVIAQDAYGNTLSLSSTPYTIRLEGATFIEDDTSEKSLFDFSQAYYLVDTSDTNAGEEVVIYLEPNTNIQAVDGTPLPVLEQRFLLQQGEIIVKDTSDQELTNIDYRLPQKDIGFYTEDQNGILQLSDTTPIQIQVEIASIDDTILTAPVEIRSGNGLVTIGQQRLRRLGDEETFVQQYLETDDIFLIDDKVTITLVPTGVSGRDEIILRTPGVTDVIIPIIIRPSGPENIDIQIDPGTISPGKEIAGQAVITDSRGNVFDEPATVDLETTGGWTLDDAYSTIELEDGIAKFTGIVHTGGSCGARGKVSAGYRSSETNDSSLGDDAGGNESGSGDTGPGTEEGDSDTEDASAGESEEEEIGKNGYSDDADRYDSAAAFESTSFAVEELLWPSDPSEDDLNIMYVSLYGQSRGNSSKTIDLLQNTKTLAITTQYDAAGSSNPQPVMKMMMHPDGRIDDPGSIVSELVAQGGDIKVVLGQQGGIGSIDVGTRDDYAFVQTSGDGDYNEEAAGTITYAPLTTTDSSNYMQNGQIWIDNEVVIDFIRGTMHPDYIIRFAAGNTWDITRKNKLIGSLQVERVGGIPMLTLFNGSYASEIMPFGGSSNGTDSLAIVLSDRSETPEEVALFDSIEQANNPRKSVGYRNHFANITNFSQGMTVGEATRHFGGPFVLNIGDPLLKRVKDNRTVTSTDYDDGVGKLIFSDTARILDADMIDFNADGKQDIIITYKDGSIRLQKNYGGGQPFLDVGTLMVVADGIKELFVGDVDGDGWEDIMVLTSSDKLRVYRNENGVFDVNGQVVCLDIPLGHKNVSQVRQLFVEDMDGDKKMDIVTNDINGDIKVFYGGGGEAGGNYLSSDAYECDDNWKERQQGNMQLVKSYDTMIQGSIAGEGLRYWPGLETLEPEWENHAFEEEEKTSACPTVPQNPFAKREFNEVALGQAELGDPTLLDCVDVAELSKDQMKEYTQFIMEESMKPAKDIDPWALLEEGVKKIDYSNIVPESLKPLSYKNQEISAIRASDPYEETPRYDVSKTFTDQNGGRLEKGDIVSVDVSLIPVGISGPVLYWEKITGPWIAYIDEYNKIDTFDRGNIPEDVFVNWNIGQGYTFLLEDLPLSGTTTFSYELQYNGNGYVNIEVETIKKDLFKGPTKGSLTSLFSSSAYAQGTWEKRLRAYPDDGCYKQYSLFSPGEETIDLEEWKKEKEQEYIDHFDEERTETFETLESSFDFDAITQLVGILPSIERRKYGTRTQEIMKDKSKLYLDYFVDEFEQKVNGYTDPSKESARGALPTVDKMGVFDDYEVGYQQCSGIKFGKKQCGQGLPIPFNMAFLAPGTYNIMGCKLADDQGLPIFAFPTGNPLIPVWPPDPTLAGGYFGGDAAVSQFRVYVSPTITNGLGVALCFGPYGAGINVPSPIGDVVGNCLVIAGSPLLGAQCVNGDSPVKDVASAKEQESNYILEEEQRDLYAIGACDTAAQANSPFGSPQLGGGVAVEGKPDFQQSTVATLRNEIDWIGERGYEDYDIGQSDSIGLSINGQDMLSIDKENMQGGTSFDLKVEGGSIKGLRQCIIQDWMEDQQAYFANNALSMNMQLILPEMSQLGENLDTVANMDTIGAAYQSAQQDISQALIEAKAHGTQKKQSDDPQKAGIMFQQYAGVATAIAEGEQNVFKAVQSYFDAIPIINIDYQTTMIEIPTIRQQDLTRYKIYYKERLQRNEEIVDAWKAFKVTSEQIESLSGQAAKIEARENQTKTDEVIAKLDLVLRNARRNQEIFEEYGELPDKLSAWTQTSDQYVIELTDFVNSFISQITGWLQDNANRFSRRVDTVVLLVGIIKTWQILIDLSVNWHSRCAKCRQDNYDFYSCKLSMLCVDLPIIPIPSFHLPDIIIDLSNIHLGMDVVIPDIQFSPKPFIFLQLPDLPTPQNIDISIPIPELPLLPAPPVLPELPELNLDIAINLPTLPPAPQIPKISPAIKVAVELLDFIGSIWCLFKSDVGLVAEQGVKTRIEQMTQRKQDIFPFDDLSIDLDPSPNAGFDYKITSYVDIKADFSLLYDAVDTVAGEWNAQVNKWQTSATNVLQEDVINSIGTNEYFNALDNIDTDIEIGDLGARSELNEFTQQRLASKLNQYLGGAYEEVFASLHDGLSSLLLRDEFHWLHTDVRRTLALLDTPTGVHPNIKDIQLVGEAVIEDIMLMRDRYQTIYTQVQDYDTFIENLPSQRYISSQQDNRSYTAALFSANQDIQQVLNNEQHPLTSRIDMQRELVDGFSNSLDTHSALALGMSALQHEDLRYYFGDLQKQLEKIPEGYEPGSTQKIQPLASIAQVSPLLAQASGEGDSGEGDISKVDFTQYINGFFVPGKDGDYHNVIAWNEKGTTWYEENTYEIADINADGTQDIFLYDEHHVRVKYGKQNDAFGGGGYAAVTIGPFGSMDELTETVMPTYGWITAGGSEFKLRDYDQVTYDFAREGHNLESMAWNWQHDARLDGYILAVTERVDVNYDKSWGRSAQVDPERTRYVVVLPESMTSAGLEIEVPGQLSKGSIDAYVDDGTIIQVNYYDGKKDTIKTVLQNLDAKWYYAKVSPLHLLEEAGKSTSPGFFARLFGASEDTVASPTYYLQKRGPWSRQHLAGAQKWADEQEPRLSVKLIRDITGETKGEGRTLLGNINTTYTIEGEWEDNGKVIENRITRNGKTIEIEDGNKITLEDLDYTYPLQEYFTFSAIDQAGNVSNVPIILNISVPELEIEQIEYVGVGAQVTTKMSDTIDRGQIKFERNRMGYWETLDPDTFGVKPLDPRVTGGLYAFDDHINFYDEAGNEVGSINTQSGEFSVSEPAEITVSFSEDGRGNVAIQAPVGGNADGGDAGGTTQTLFSVRLEGNVLPDNGIELLGVGYETVALESNFVGGFAGGYCIKPYAGECHIYVSEKGDIYIAPGWRHEYTAEYSYENEYVVYNIRDAVDTLVSTIRFSPKPLN